jgi:hypothetical protein
MGPLSGQMPRSMTPGDFLNHLMFTGNMLRLGSGLEQQPTADRWAELLRRHGYMAPAISQIGQRQPDQPLPQQPVRGE